jgi:hypothetical protein
LYEIDIPAPLQLVTDPTEWRALKQAAGLVGTPLEHRMFLIRPPQVISTRIHAMLTLIHAIFTLIHRRKRSVAGARRDCQVILCHFNAILTPCNAAEPHPTPFNAVFTPF